MTQYKINNVLFFSYIRRVLLLFERATQKGGKIWVPVINLFYNNLLEIKRRRLRWLGHTLRMNVNRTMKIALRWTPPGKRKQGRPKNTWRRTITSELKKMGYHGVKHRGLQVTECNGGRRLMPYVPLGMKRISKSK